MLDGAEVPAAFTAWTLTRAPAVAAFVRMTGVRDAVRATTRPLMTTRYALARPRIRSFTPEAVRVAATSLGVDGRATVPAPGRGRDTPPARSGLATGSGALAGVVSRAGASAGAGATPDDTLSSRFAGDFGSVMTPRVAPCTIAVLTPAGVAEGVAASSSAAAPATCGAAMDVPDSVAVAVGEVWYAERMPEPGANRSRQEPQFENDDRASDEVVDPTVSADGSDAGDALQASASELPAATANVMPSATPAATAALSAAE